MFQSHIQGDWNDNVWNEKNYLHFPFKNNIQINKKYIRFVLYDFN